jgi:hypothetical protein
MNDTLDILDKALVDLELMSSEELILRTKKAGVVIPKEIGFSFYLQYFNLDLKGMFDSTLVNQGNWMPPYLVNERTYISVSNENKSHSKVALSF